MNLTCMRLCLSSTGITSMKKKKTLTHKGKLMRSFTLYFFLCVWMFGLHVCLCSVCFPGALGVKKRVLDPHTLTSRTAVRWGATKVLGLKLGSSGRALSTLQCPAISPAQILEKNPRPPSSKSQAMAARRRAMAERKQLMLFWVKGPVGFWMRAEKSHTRFTSDVENENFIFFKNNFF